MVSQGIVALFLKLWFVALPGGTVAGIGVIGASLFSPPVVLPLVSGKCVRVVFFLFLGEENCAMRFGLRQNTPVYINHACTAGGRRRDGEPRR